MTQIRNTSATILLVALAIVPTVAHAATITNDVRAAASTGGNVVSDGGTVVTGDRTVEVHVENVVNGETIQRIETSRRESDGDETIVQVESSVRVEGDEVRVEGTVNGEPVHAAEVVGAEAPRAERAGNDDRAPDRRGTVGTVVELIVAVVQVIAAAVQEVLA